MKTENTIMDLLKMVEEALKISNIVTIGLEINYSAPTEPHVIIAVEELSTATKKYFGFALYDNWDLAEKKKQLYDTIAKVTSIYKYKRDASDATFWARLIEEGLYEDK